LCNLNLEYYYHGQVPDRLHRVAKIPIEEIDENFRGKQCVVTYWPSEEIAVVEASRLSTYNIKYHKKCCCTYRAWSICKNGDGMPRCNQIGILLVPKNGVLALWQNISCH